MYYCNDCKETFSMPEYLVDIKHFQCTEVCPHCRSENFDEAPDFLDKIKDELTIDDMINYSQKSKVEISDFILKVLGEKQINNILKVINNDYHIDIIKKYNIFHIINN